MSQKFMEHNPQVWTRKRNNLAPPRIDSSKGKTTTLQPSSAWCMYRVILGRCAATETHLWIQFVHSPDSILNVSPLDGTPNNHSVLDALQVDLRAHASLD